MNLSLMEGSESEAVFDSLNLNPQLFINEVLNAVDDMVQGAFDFYHQQACGILGDAGKDRSEELSRGVASIHHLVQAVLDKRLDMWEKYCLRHCFAVPEGFSLPKSDSSSDNLMLEDVLSDTELDDQLRSLRQKLAAVGRESTELHGELHALKKQSLLSSSCAGSLTETLEPFQQNFIHDMFHEMVRTASELRKKMESLKNKRREEIESTMIKRIYSPNSNHSMVQIGPSVNLEDLQEFLDDMRNM